MSPISIVSIASISPLGHTKEQVLKSYRNHEHFIDFMNFDDHEHLVSKLSKYSEIEIDKLLNENKKFKNLDRSVLLAIYASRMAFGSTDWKSDNSVGVNIGSSRGATQVLEANHSQFIATGESSVLSSPTTTLGNISSWVAHDLNTKGPDISHSITCSTSLHSVLNGIAWLKSGMCDKFLVGGSEAPLTAFTISQMRALKIYAKDLDTYPSKPLDFDKEINTMVLGEASAIACLENDVSSNSIALIKGIGYATEILRHNASISSEAKCFQRSMSMALGSIPPNDIDVIITHTPGTLKGDKAELKAIAAVFGNNPPLLLNNKWKIGHTLGASGLMSMEMAILMLQHQECYSIPYLKSKEPKDIRQIMVNSVGFGGNAVSIILSIP